MNKKPDSYSQPRLDSIFESSDRTELLSTNSAEPITMDSTLSRIRQKENPFQTANCFSKIFFW